MDTESIQALLDDNNEFPNRLLYKLSDLEAENLSEFISLWDKLPENKRYTLISNLEQLANEDTLLSFEAISRIALQDKSPRVRYIAIRSLSTYDLSVDLIPILANILTTDADSQVRSISAHILGEFVYLGEIDSIPLSKLREIEDILFNAIKTDNNPIVRMKAMEALGYSSREEITGIIQTAYDSGDSDWVASALLAMGRSYNNAWNSHVINELTNDNERIRCEAIKSAGELEIEDAIPQLLEALDDPSEEIRSASIWALSQIGGEGVFERLSQMLDDVEEDDEIELLENALDNLAFNEDFKLFDLMNIPTDELFIHDDEQFE